MDRGAFWKILSNVGDELNDICTKQNKTKQNKKIQTTSKGMSWTTEWVVATKSLNLVAQACLGIFTIRKTGWELRWESSLQDRVL